MESGLYLANFQPVGVDMAQDGLTSQKERNTIGGMTEANELVSEFLKTELEPECDNPDFRSSIISELDIDKSVPIDCAIPVCRGSTANKKIKVLSRKYQKNFEL